jgi:hypothetical protein
LADVHRRDATGEDSNVSQRVQQWLMAMALLSGLIGSLALAFWQMQ